MEKKEKDYPYLYETHLHTSQSSACAVSGGAGMARACREAGYTGIFVTDHNWGGNTAVPGRLDAVEALRSVKEEEGRLLPRPSTAAKGGRMSWRDWITAFAAGYEAAREEGAKIGLDVFFGWEAGYCGTEFLIYGLTPEWLSKHPELADADVKEQYYIIKKAGGMVIHAHPYREEDYIPKIRLFPDFVDGVEGVNATHANPASKKHNDPAYDRKASAYAAEHDLPLTAGSDIHSDRLFGGGMAFRRRLASPADFIQAVTGGEDYLLTDGEQWYDRRGRRL